MICNICNDYNNKQDAKRVDRVRNYRNETFKNIERYYSDYQKSAKKRGYDMNLLYSDFHELVISQCHYCHYFKEQETNGIDRVDNSKGYEKDNCVPCCETCNMMKNAFSSIFFIKLCKIISGFELPSDEFYTKWNAYYVSRPRCYSTYKKHAENNRHLPFHITKEQWKSLILKPCYLCGFQSKRGIGLDRVDSSKREYTINNVEPCCYTCNVIKKNFTLEQIQEKATLISCIWS
jgi:hypothetical protein